MPGFSLPLRPAEDPEAAGADDYLKVLCPTCAAGTGELCLTNTGRPVKPVKGVEILYRQEWAGVHRTRRWKFHQLQGSCIGRYMLVSVEPEGAFRPGNVICGYEDDGKIVPVAIEGQFHFGMSVAPVPLEDVSLIEFTEHRSNSRVNWDGVFA